MHLFLIPWILGMKYVNCLLQNVQYFDVRHILGTKIQHQIEYSLSLTDFAWYQIKSWYYVWNDYKAENYLEISTHIHCLISKLLRIKSELPSWILFYDSKYLLTVLPHEKILSDISWGEKIIYAEGNKQFCFIWWY